MTTLTQPEAHPTSVPTGSATQTGAPPPPAAATVGGQGQAASDEAVFDAQAHEVFAQRCVLCHGLKGQGNGVAAENLRPKPRNLQDKDWQIATTDAQIAAIISKGGAGVGKSMMMPANPDLVDRPQVLAGLVKIVRSFNK